MRAYGLVLRCGPAEGSLHLFDVIQGEIARFNQMLHDQLGSPSEQCQQFISDPGTWTSWGPHEHAATLEEMYVFFDMPSPAYGIQLVYVNADSPEVVTVVREGDAVLMPAALHRYRTQRMRILEAGHMIPVVAARGPLCSAAFMRGLTQLMLDITDNPSAVHKLMSYTTDATIRWLRAQAEVIGCTVEGMFILDDIVGFLSRPHYLEFAHPYLKHVFESFPSAWVKVYHNDANIEPFLEDLADVGFDVLNWTHKIEPQKVRERTTGKICLMGNIAPVEMGTHGAPQDVKRAALDLLRSVDRDGLILSLGGGVSPGMPGANIVAIAEAVREFNSQ